MEEMSSVFDVASLPWSDDRTLTAIDQLRKAESAIEAQKAKWISRIEAVSTWTDEQALVAIDEHARTNGEVAALEAKLTASTRAMSVDEANALLAERREALELVAMQKALWHSYVETSFRQPTTTPDPMADPSIVAYYQTPEPPDSRPDVDEIRMANAREDEARRRGATKRARRLFSRPASGRLPAAPSNNRTNEGREAGERQKWATLLGTVNAIGTLSDREATRAGKQSKQSKPINETRSEAMNKEEGVKPAAKTAAQPATQAGDGAADVPFFDWGDPPPNAAELAAEGDSRADASEWADRRTDRRTQSMGAQVDLQANGTGTDTLTEEQELAEAKMLKRIVDTAEGMASAPAGAVPGDETMVSVVAGDLKALAAIRTPELRERALWVMAESRHAQPAYDAEIFLRTTPELREEMAVAARARAAGLAASGAIDQAVKVGTPTVANTITPVPAATQQATVASTEDKTSLNIALSTSNLLASLPVDGISKDAAAEYVREDISALSDIQDAGMQRRALDAIKESSRAQPRYMTELERQAPAVAAEVGAPEMSQADKADEMHVQGIGETLSVLMEIDKRQTKEEAATLAANIIEGIREIQGSQYRQQALAISHQIGNFDAAYKEEFARQAPDLVDAAAAAHQAERELEVAERAALQSAGVENTIEPAPAVVLERETVPEIDAAALEAVAAARAKDRQAVAKSFGWNTIEKGETAERKPVAQVPGQLASAVPVVAVPTAPEPISTVVPDEVERAYLHVGNRFYMPKNPQRVAFEDHGDKLKSALSDTPVTIAMVQIAQARGWTSIKVNGTPEFCKEAWRQASLRGLAVDGYKPTELDLADLARRMPKKAHENQVAATATAAAAATATATAAPAPAPAAQGGFYISAEDAALLAVAKAARTAQAAPAAPAAAPVPRAAAVPTTPGASVPPGDKLVAHGPAKYQHNPDNPESYFAVLENAQGKQRTVWGVKLGEAIAKAGVNVGDQITLYKNGEEQVTVDANVKDNAGKVVGTQKIGATRNEWAVKAHAFTTLPPAQAVQQHPDLAGAFGAATKLGLQAKADGFSPAALAVIAARQQENIGKAIARGELPKADLRERVEAKRSPQQEMAQ